MLGKPAFLLAVTTSIVCSQDPTVTLPNNYKNIFENEWVRVVRVHYGPHEKLPIHDHTRAAAAYVYLADGGPVLFRHVEPYQVVSTRPAVKLGGFRMYRAITERHEVANTSDLSSEYLRVEFKVLPDANPGLHGRFPPPELAAGQTLERVEYDDANLRVVRSVCPAHHACEPSPIEWAGLEIAFNAAELVEKTARVDCAQLRAGGVRWVTPLNNGEVWNAGDTAAHRLRFELKGVH